MDNQGLLKKRIVLEQHDIQSCYFPPLKGVKPTATVTGRETGRTYCIYSRGILEAVLREGFEVYVICDEIEISWWTKLIKKGNVFLTPGLRRKNMPPPYNRYVVRNEQDRLDPWKRLFTHLGFVLPDNVKKRSQITESFLAKFDLWTGDRFRREHRQNR